jgi:MFS transporter, DHA1 family, inner membrane transport protein
LAPDSTTWASSPSGHVGNGDKPISLAEEVAVLGRGQVLLGLAMTVFGFAGLFVVFTHIQPILTRFTGFSDAAVSPILLVFGVGLANPELFGVQPTGDVIVRY